MRISGSFWNGRTSERFRAVLEVADDGSVRMADRENPDREFFRGTWEALEVSPRLGSTPRRLEWPGGGAFETEDNDRVDAVQRTFGRGVSSRGLHHMENRWRWVMAAVLLFFLLAFGTVRHGIPFAARLIAARLPASVATSISRQTLMALDGGMFGKSALSEKVQERLHARFASLREYHSDLDIRILFRKGGRIGANAFALPDGTIVVTDELVAISQHDEELESIVAHEVGHVVGRHGMRTVVQDSLFAFGFMALTGDVSGSSELVLGIPVFLTQRAYSRGFEREADAYALGWLLQEGISPLRFADIMRRLEAQQGGGEGAKLAEWAGYLATHPDTAERVAVFEREARKPE